MSYRNLIFLFFVLIFSSLIFSYAFISRFSKESFLLLEKEKAISVVKKAEIYFTNQLDMLYNIARDWGAWDDAYFFVQNKNQDFVKKNLAPESYESLKVDLLLYTDLDGSILAGGLCDKKTHKIYVSLELLSLVKSLIKNLSLSGTQGLKKFTFFEGKPFLIAVYPVLRTNYAGPERGYFFTGRFLDSKDVEDVMTLTGVTNVEILRTDGTDKEREFPETDLSKNGEETGLKKASEETRYLKVDLREIVLEKSPFLSNTGARIRITYPLNYSLISSLINYAAFSQVCLLVVTYVIIFLLANSCMFKPFLKLLREVNQVKDKEITKLSLEYRIKEYVDLGMTINKLLEDISVREEIYRSIAERTENMVIIFDRSGNVLYQNANVSRHFSHESVKLLINTFFNGKRYAGSLGSFSSTSSEEKNHQEKSLIKELKIENRWFIFQMVSISRDLYLLIGQDITAIKEREEKLFELATRDFLTGLYNRHYLEDALNRIVSSSKRGEKFTLLFIDCNGLKRINDVYGHLTGDEALKTIARVIKKSIRNGDLAARWGGDEFVVILNNRDKSVGVKVAERIMNNLSTEEINVDSEKIKLSVSIGVVEIDGTKEINEILELADELCYKSKRTGKVEV